MMIEECDVLVLGGGPGGSTVASLLAAFGFEVTVLERARFPRYHIGESLTPKVDALFKQLGILDAIEADGFVRMAGNYDCWSQPRPIVQPFEVKGRAAQGYQVDRSRFDALLLGHARACGADVREEIAVMEVLRSGERATGARWVSADGRRRGETRCRFLFDATGRRGLLGRSFRREDEHHRTVSVTRYWANAGGPPGTALAHTFTESLPEGWIWSLPLASGLRNITVLLERDAARRRGRRSLKALYHENLASSRHARGFVRGAEETGKWRITDATWYFATRHAGPGWALLGDAADFVDPLSSQGVFKAMSGGVGGAAVARTTLRYPERAELAARYFDLEQKHFTREVSHNMSLAYRGVSRWRNGGFWKRRRKRYEGVPGRRVRPAERGVRRNQLVRLRDTQQISQVRFRRPPDDRLEKAPVMRGGLIEEHDVIRGPRYPVGLDLPEEPHLALIFRLVDEGRPLRQLVPAYLRSIGARTSPRRESRLMASIAFLFEEGALEIADGS